MTAFNVIELAYNLYMLWALWVVVRSARRIVPHLLNLLALAASWGLLAVVPVMLLMPLARAFGTARLLAWALLLHGPLVLGGIAIVNWRRSRLFAALLLFVAAALATVAVDASLIEPHMLQVSHTTIRSAKLNRPVRIALMADIQTDAPGDYERHVFDLLMREKPDVVLFAGDYVQHVSSDRYHAACAQLEAIMRAANIHAPLGMYAVHGDVDPRGTWTQLFARMPVQTFESTTNLDLGPIELTVLGKRDSKAVTLSVTASNKFHVVLGHSPSYAMGDIKADLMVAGHTHGGQVRVPFLGPIITFAAVPHAWAAGATTLPDGRTLVVSRGIGMERQKAPRIRFCCPPELPIIDLLPNQ